MPAALALAGVMLGILAAYAVAELHKITANLIQ